MVLAVVAHGSLAGRIKAPSCVSGPALRQATVTAAFLGALLPLPCMGQRLVNTPAFAPLSFDVREPLHPHRLATVRTSDTHKSLGLWIGFGLGALAVPFVWSSCERGSEGCTPGQKTLIAGALPLGGAILGSFVGKQFRKGGKPSPSKPTTDSTRRSPHN